MINVFIGKVDAGKVKRVMLRKEGQKRKTWWTFRTPSSWTSFFKRWRHHDCRKAVGFNDVTGRFYF